jgi:pantothenate kinase
MPPDQSACDSIFTRIVIAAPCWTNFDEAYPSRRPDCSDYFLGDKGLRCAQFLPICGWRSALRRGNRCGACHNRCLSLEADGPLHLKTDYDELLALIVARGAKGRTLTAIAGPPGSGKSQLAERLVAALNKNAPGSAAVVPMDGFHFDDILLDAWDLRHRKGAPETFDVFGFQHMLERLSNNTEEQIAIPVFDRNIEVARAGARMIHRSVRYVIIEGNYLLLNEDPWTNLKKYFTSTVMLRADLETLRKRLMGRWENLGLAPAGVIGKVEGNDMLNVRRVVNGSVPAEFVLGSE